MSQQYGENLQVYFHKVDKIAYGSSYMILKLLTFLLQYPLLFTGGILETFMKMKL